MVTCHPDTQFLIEYTTGSFSLAPCISITTHLQFCDKCREEVNSLQTLGGELLAECKSVPVADDLLDKVMNSLEQTPVASRQQDNVDGDESAKSLPSYLKKLLPAGQLKWRNLSPSLRVAPISVGEQQYELALHRIKAGGKAPEHDHTGREITVVLTGSFSDEDGLYQVGDFIVREPGDIHRPYAAQHEACVCLSVLQAPIRLTGIKRVMNPFLSFTPA